MSSAVRVFLPVVVISIVFSSCGSMRLSMSDASVFPAKTCQVNYFENRADIVIPKLSSQVTLALKDKIQANTSLTLVNNNPNVLFEGEITGYNIQAQQVTAGGTAAKDRLTITVKVKFTNELKPEYNYDKSFSRFREFNPGTPTSTIEGTFVDQILTELMDDIFNEAFSNW